MTCRSCAAGLIALMLCSAAPVSAQLALETETARLPARGVLEMGANFEYQVSNVGHETALPFAILYGLRDRLELAIEPVPYTAIRQHAVRHATGLGDMEVTLTWLLSREAGNRPALAIAGEVKMPTAKDTLIGTGKADFAAYLIASHRIGRVDLHANAGYTIVGKVPNANLTNVMNAAGAAEFSLTPRTALYAEVLATTSSLRSGVPESATTPEAGGGELVGTVGISRMVTSRLQLTMGMSVDNSGAVLFRPGFSLRHR